MNLKHLQFANALASTGSFTAAADACFVTQPTLSNGIAQLEDELGGRLFARTTRSVSLTPLGTHLLPRIADVLAAQSQLGLQARAFLSPDRRLVRVGTSPLVDARLLGLMVEPFKRADPGVDLVLREMNMADLYRMLGDGELDFVLGAAPAAGGPWATAGLYSEPLMFVPRGGPAAGAPGAPGAAPVPFKAIASETFVMVPGACGLAQATRALFRSHRARLHTYPGEAMGYQVLEQWAALGIGAAILPRSKLSAQATQARPIADKSGREVSLAFEASWKRGAETAPHLRAFADHLRRVAPAVARGLGPGTASVSAPAPAPQPPQKAARPRRKA